MSSPECDYSILIRFWNLAHRLFCQGALVLGRLGRFVGEASDRMLAHAKGHGRAQLEPRSIPKARFWSAGNIDQLVTHCMVSFPS